MNENLEDIDVLLLARWDWSNSSWRYVKCMEHLGLNVVAYKGVPHSLHYPEEIEIHPVLAKFFPICLHPIIVPAHELKLLAEKAKVIWLATETYTDTGIDLKKKKVIVDFRGQTYLRNMDACQAVFNRVTDTSVIAWLPLYGHGLNNEQLVMWPVDTDFIQPSYKADNSKLIIGHFPSDPRNKGTEVIINVVDKLKERYGDKFEYVGLLSSSYDKNATTQTYHLNWPENLECIKQCDIIIETIKPMLHGIPLGDWSNTALEAAASGKIIVTNFRNTELYEKEYGNHEIQIANNAEQLEHVLKQLFKCSHDEIVKKQKAARKWVEDKHSIPVTAQRLWDLVLKPLLQED